MKSENQSQVRRRKKVLRRAGAAAKRAAASPETKGRKRPLRKASGQDAKPAKANGAGASRRRVLAKRKSGQGAKPHVARAAVRKPNGKAPARKPASAGNGRRHGAAATSLADRASSVVTAAVSALPSYLDSAQRRLSYAWAEEELVLDSVYGEGDADGMVPNIQEWLSLHGVATAIDGDYGPATASAVAQFQADNGLEETGETDEETFAALVSPMVRALQRISPDSHTLGELTVAYAEQHLAEHPREAGGQNRGPWVRLYMQGQDGEPFAWCAGYVCFMIQQAADTLGVEPPFDSTFSCDELARNGSDEGLFVSESELASGSVSPDEMPPGSVFLNRQSETDWTHTGIVVEFGSDAIQTIEGNTNDEGSREGYEVCRRVRSYATRDFVVVSD